MKNDSIKISNYYIERYKILDTLIEGCAIIDFNWLILFANKSMLKFPNLTLGQVLRKKLTAVIPGIENSIFFNSFKVCMENRIPQRIEDKFVFVDGKIGWFEVRVQPVQEGIFVLSLDITSRKLAEEALIKSEDHYRTLFNSIDEGFCVVEVLFDENNKPIDLIYLEVNPAFEKHTKLTNPVGKRIRQIYPAQEEYWFELYGKVALTGESATVQFYSERLQGWYDVYAFSVGNPKNHKVGIIFNEITERKKAEDHLKTTLLELEHSHENLNQANNKLKEYSADLENLNETKDKLFSIVAHDLRSPFQVLITVANLLIEDLESFNKEEIKHIAEELRKTVKIQFEVVDNLLTWVQLQRGKMIFNPRRIFLFDKVNLVMEQLKIHSENKNIEITNSVPKDFIAIGDMDMLQTVFHNLIYNSIKYCNKGGRIEINSVKSGGKIITSVSDNGIGMDENLRRLLFTIDRKIKREGTMEEKGTGLGLHLCKEMIEKQNGQIWVESDLGKGSTFYFSLHAAEFE